MRSADLDWPCQAVPADLDWPCQAVPAGLTSLDGVDGTDGHPSRARATHEPIIPEDVIIAAAAIGAAIPGSRLDERSVHRSELAA